MVKYFQLTQKRPALMVTDAWLQERAFLSTNSVTGTFTVNTKMTSVIVNFGVRRTVPAPDLKHHAIVQG